MSLGKWSSVYPVTESLPKGDDLVARLWKLEDTLQGLGFTEVQVEKVLKYILRFPPPEDADTQVWALERSLDWLALNESETALPIFDNHSGKPVKLDDGKDERGKSIPCKNPGVYGDLFEFSKFR